jgi:uncharacterized protein
MAATKIAVIGSGIAGLSVAHTLQGRAQITLFEAEGYFGGHTHTVDVTLPVRGSPVTHGVDTGFLVFNERTYPNLINLLGQLDVQTAKSDMSFSVTAPDVGLEWCGSSLDSVFAQRSNLVRPAFWRMLADTLRFNHITTRIARTNDEAALVQPLGEFLQTHRFSQEFRDWYFLPMMGCIWSCPPAQMLQFPVATMIRFCHNHGLLQITNRPQWHTVAGGAKHYVQKIVDGVADKRLNTPVRLIARDAGGVRIITDGHAERFDAVVLAVHSDQALQILEQPTQQERRLLGKIHYQTNRAVLHTDASVLPSRRKAWAAWNYEHTSAANGRDTRVCLHYLINKLQPLPFEQPVIVSLNPQREIAPELVIGEYAYAHPVFDLEAIRAQADLPQLQGQQHTYFCGAWTGYGFHEDGLKSGLQVARALLQRMEGRTPQTGSNDSGPAPWMEAA